MTVLQIIWWVLVVVMCVLVVIIIFFILIYGIALFYEDTNREYPIWIKKMFNIKRDV